MNVEFYSSHMETLKDLQLMAEKHDCKINFGFENDYDNNVNVDLLLQETDFTKELWEEFNDNINYYDMNSNYSAIWFELIDCRDKDHNTYHSLKYIVSSTNFRFDTDNIDDDTCSKELLDAVDDLSNLDYGDGYIYVSSSYTVVKGFNLTTDCEKSYLVYRSGMALKFFSDYVCDYLKEPRIERTY